MDATINHVLTTIKYEDEPGVAAYNLENGADSALWELRRQRAHDVCEKVLRNYGFELGLT